MNEQNIQLEEEGLQGRQTTDIAIKAAADAVMLAANAVSAAPDAAKRKTEEEVCLMREEHE